MNTAGALSSLVYSNFFSTANFICGRRLVLGLDEAYGLGINLVSLKCKYLMLLLVRLYYC